jgi:hypothetical protein
MKFDKLHFWFISNLKFGGYTGSTKNKVHRKLFLKSKKSAKRDETAHHIDRASFPTKLSSF